MLLVRGPVVQWLVQRFRSERLWVRSRRSATFTPSAHVRRQSLPVWPPLPLLDQLKGRKSFSGLQLVQWDGSWLDRWLDPSRWKRAVAPRLGLQRGAPGKYFLIIGENQPQPGELCNNHVCNNQQHDIMSFDRRSCTCRQGVRGKINLFCPAIHFLQKIGCNCHGQGHLTYASVTSFFFSQFPWIKFVWTFRRIGQRRSLS